MPVIISCRQCGKQVEIGRTVPSVCLGCGSTEGRWISDSIRPTAPRALTVDDKKFLKSLRIQPSIDAQKEP